MSDDEDQLVYCSYEEFGDRFFRAAVTRERVLGAVDQLAGQPIDFGPVGVGPGRVAQVTARGEIGAATATEIPGDEIAYRVELPVRLDFDLNLQLDTHHFHGDLVVPLTVHARATEDLKIVVDVTAPGSRDIELDLKADGMRASLLKRVAGVDVEVKRFVAKFVAREIDKPEVVAARIVDVGATIDATWARMASS